MPPPSPPAPGTGRSDERRTAAAPHPRSVPLCTVCVTPTPGPCAPASAHSGRPQLCASLLKGRHSACCSAELFSEAARFHLAARMLGRGGGGTLETAF